MKTAFKIEDGLRTISFDGELLAEVSSRNASSPRWSEYRVYRTDGGRYVLEVVGASIVVHMPDCPEIRKKLKRFQEEKPGQDPLNGYFLCESCVMDKFDITRLVIEENRVHVMDTSEPSELIDALYRHKRGTRSLPQISLELIARLSEVDEDIKQAFNASNRIS